MSGLAIQTGMLAFAISGIALIVGARASAIRILLVGVLLVVAGTVIP